MYFKHNGMSSPSNRYMYYYAAMHNTVNKSSSLQTSTYIRAVYNCLQLYIVKNMKTQISQQSIY